MDFSRNKPSRNFEDRTNLNDKRTFDYLNDIIGTYLLRRKGQVPDPMDVSSLPRRDRINVEEELKSYMEALFDKANRYYGPSAFRPNPGPVGRAAMDHQLTDPRQRIPLEDFTRTGEHIFRTAKPRKR